MQIKGQGMSSVIEDLIACSIGMRLYIWIDPQYNPLVEAFSSFFR